MPDNIGRTRGRGAGYKFDRGGTPTEFGPFIGVVKSNIDPTRSGRLKVYIEQFSGGDEDNEDLWRTVSYIPPFYGHTPYFGNNQDPGKYIGNPQSYGMWFNPPDKGVSVICFFVAGDPNQGYYIGCVPEPGFNHMIPAVGASKNYIPNNDAQAQYFQNISQAPVSEINPENEGIRENSRFFDQRKPVHSYQAAAMLQQGVLGDTLRGPITSNSQRETPSNVFGISTPGRPVYAGGMNDEDITEKLASGELDLDDVDTISRRGGHTFVMDDGALNGTDNLIRLRTSKGHQITMSDNGNCFYIIHANGQSWIELGQEGTVDVYSTNSVNVRTQGTINLHADKDINMYAGTGFNVKSPRIKMQATETFAALANDRLSLHSNRALGLNADGSLLMKSYVGGWNAGSELKLKSDMIDLNGGSPTNPVVPTEIPNSTLADTAFVQGSGWQVTPDSLTTIVSRAPTHEPYPYHNRAVENNATLTMSGSGVPSYVPTGSDGFAVPSASLTGANTQLNNLPVTNPLTVSQLANQIPAAQTLGSLNTTDVTAMLASAKVQDPSAITSQGLGAFGFSPQQLEDTGFLKPGTVTSFIQNTDLTNVESVLKSPQVWTGKDSVTNLTSFLTSPQIQNTAQQALYNNSLVDLQNIGALTGFEAPEQLSSVLQIAGKFGTGSAADWLNGSISPDLASAANLLGKDAQYAVNLVNTSLADVGSLTALTSAGPFTLGNLANLGNLDSLTNLGSIGSLVGQLGSLDSVISQGISGLTSQLGNLGSLTDGLDGALGSISEIPTLGNIGGGFTGGRGRADPGPRDVVAPVPVPPGVLGTVDRTPLTAAITDILGDARVPVPGYGVPPGSDLASVEGDPYVPTPPVSSGALFTLDGTQSYLTKATAESAMQETLRRYDRMVEFFGRSVTINDAIAKSGTSREQNTRGSQHFNGTALDLSTRGLSDQDKIRLFRAAQRAGFTGFGFGRNILHVDTGPARSWAYGNSTYGGIAVSTMKAEAARGLA